MVKQLSYVSHRSLCKSSLLSSVHRRAGCGAGHCSMEGRRPEQGDNMSKDMKVRQSRAVLPGGKASQILTLASCVTLGKLLGLSEPPFSHCKRGILEEPSSQDCCEE